MTSAVATEAVKARLRQMAEERDMGKYYSITRVHDLTKRDMEDQSRLPIQITLSGHQEKSSTTGLPLSAIVKGQPEGEMMTWSTGSPSE